MSTDCNENELVCFAHNILQKHQNALENIFENVSDETIFRSIINRTYYGVFLRARNKAGIKRESASIHQDVINHYEKIKLTKVSNSLSKLRKSRELADYKTSEKVTIQDARSSLRIAKNILEVLDSSD
ncbi:MAG: hypothetical protein ACR65O_05010 [Methylomicrobium sp.]